MKKKQKMGAKSAIKDQILSKFVTGRTKSHMKRKRTLLLEYKLRNKSNRFIDRRIGEKNRGMTADDRLMARFAAERVKHHRKKALYNLGDDDSEVLTHQGRSLQDIEKFQDPIDDDDDPDESGKLDANYVKMAHFGGGLFTKVNCDDSKRESIIDQLIIESKKRKAEQQSIRDHTIELTEKLDKDLGELLPLVTKLERKKDDSIINEENGGKSVMQHTEPYDSMLNELKFEITGKGGSRQKTQLEIEIEEKKKIEALEQERIKRMKKFTELDLDEKEEPPSKIPHQSADDLDDQFQMDEMNSEDDYGEDEEESGKEDICEEESEHELSEDEENEKVDDTNSVKTARICIKGTDDMKNTKCASEKEIKLPATYTDLKNMLKKHCVSEQANIIRNIVIKFHPSTCGSKRELSHIFPFILQHIDEIAKYSSVKDCLTLTEKLCPLLYDITQLDSDSVAELIFEKLKIKRSSFNQQKNPTASMDMLIFLKLIPLLFPTSDFHHPVATPAIVFICQILTQQSCNSNMGISIGLFCTTLLLEYIELSSRFCPEAVNFLMKILSMALPCEDISKVENTILILELDCSNETFSENDIKLTAEDLELNSNFSDDIFKVKIMNVTLKLINSFVKHSEKLSSAYMIWFPILQILNNIPIQKYPTIIKLEHEKVCNCIRHLSEKKLTYLMAEKKRPKVLRLYEPNIRQVIEGRSFRTLSQTKLEHNKLVHKYKMEWKGAVKEIRKDRNFLADVKFKEQARRDAERQARVKQIYSWGENQQSEFKRMERQNRYRH